MKRVLMATVAAIGLIATSANAFQADQPRQQPKQYNQQLDKLPNQKIVVDGGWQLMTWNDQFTDGENIVAYVGTAQSGGAVGVRCFQGVDLQVLLGSPHLKQGDDYRTIIRVDQNQAFDATGVAVDSNLLQFTGGTGFEEFIAQLATGQTLIYKTENDNNTYKVNLGGTGTNALGRVLKACANYQNKTSQTKSSGRGA